MSKTNNKNELTIDQLKTILNNDHIRQHLIQSGYIDNRGNVVRKNDEDNNHHSQRPYTANKSKTNSKSPDQKSNNHRLKSASTVQSKTTNKSQNSICVQNVLLRRAVSPKILEPADRCLVTLTYYGPELNIDYDRDYFEPNGDEISVMQQHCGGENWLAFKGFLKPDELFSFHSRRHTDYPFALAFYVNGVIKDRLSVCCESRCKNFMRIGGKRCLFAIANIDNARVCRRCRYEERMKKLLQTYPESAAAIERRRRKSEKSHKTPVKNSSPEKKSSDKSTRARSSSPNSIKSDSSNSKPSKTNGFHSPTPQHVESSSAKAKSSVSPTTVSPTNNVRSPTPEPIVSHTKTSKIDPIRSRSPQEIESDTSNEEPIKPPSTVSRTKNSQTSNILSSSPQPIDSDTSNSEPIVSRPKTAKTVVKRPSTPQEIESDASIPEQNQSSIPNRIRSKSPEEIESDASDQEPVKPPIMNSKPSAITQESKSSPPLRIGSATMSNKPPQTTNLPNAYDIDFEEPITTNPILNDNKPTETPASDSSDTRRVNRFYKTTESSDSDDELDDEYERYHRRNT